MRQLVSQGIDCHFPLDGQNQIRPAEATHHHDDSDSTQPEGFRPRKLWKHSVDPGIVEGK